ncbi:phage tail protein [Spirosoma sp. KCTC 42546]|uniref:phage tail protein n=1 Tax=Spirosoma sp. KCTC 42546 TaxID=2520506 RepID=UPI00115757F0|nr:phage tail protein [Spirosoma sp. KCTC 42546]QDK82116.1 phage tail protein [Spirosoma sp. KCTC 42546]
MAAVYALPKFHFQVEWGGARIGFSEVTGLNLETDVIEYRDGASPEFHKIKMPGLQKFSNITLKRGTFKADNDFFNWWNTVALNTIQRRDLTISLLNEAHQPVVVWKIKQAWPSKVMSGDLKADASEVLIESIELVHEGLTIQNE